MELTDLEINKRIAEIEGIDAKIMPYSTKILYAKYETDGVRTPYNPLTDGALCLNLIDMYAVNIKFVGGYIFARCGEQDGWVKGSDIKMVSCLAIIEANKGEQCETT